MKDPRDVNVCLLNIRIISTFDMVELWCSTWVRTLAMEYLTLNVMKHHS